MERRKYLAAASAGTTALLSGCSSLISELSGESQLQDTDGDSVPDEHDYAPKDPSVQAKSDAVGRTTTSTTSFLPNSTVNPSLLETTTTTTESGFDFGGETVSDPDTISTTTSDGADNDIDIPGTSTVTQTSELELPTNRVMADTEAIANRTSHFTAYSLQEATVKLTPETIDGFYLNGARLFVVAGAYPDELMADEDAYGYGFSDKFEVTETTQTISLDFESRPGYSFYLQAYLFPGDTSLETANIEDAEFLCETNRLEIASNRLTAEEPEPEVADFETDGFARRSGEGCYILEFDGSVEYSHDWQASFVAYKANYVQASEAIRAPERAEYVQTAQNSGLADALAVLLEEEAEENQFTTKQEKVRFVIDFVQNLPYVPDDVSTDYDDYTKSVTETLVEGGGDCEDTAILMAAVLQAEPFNYDCILIQPPGHMAVGVYGTDLPGTYWEYDGRRYYYLETTGDGWEVGEIPDEYDGEKAYLHEV
ncbi:hypothetical protein [Halorubellus sp. PRR65]|uniref:hypothetical protein n=1 Tax=Halorubellus sp. PRR65 TaxID=3098148 RepID=UPI002B26329A|nr:hypothetical protein [Halorubellus sp. PRR65]